ncbi:MAG: hypothetical protein LBM02_08005 [Lachnospiraceae bacterium]|jgi:integrase|nr:hypothetical protein [Lachnospiraceae bacterium]
MSLMDKKDIEILEEMETDKKWSKGTFVGYKHTVNLYTTFNEKNLYELITEAELEEEKGVRWKNRKLLKRLINFRSYLIDNYSGSSVFNHFNRITAIYNYFLIEIHKIPKINTKALKNTKPISFHDLPSKKILRKAIEISKPDMVAIIFFMSSSGCGKSEVLSFTIKDFIIATNNYHDISHEIENENPKERKIIEKNNIDLLIKTLMAHEKVIPTFDIHRAKTNKYYFSFCSHEAVTAILNHLLTRSDCDNLTYDSKLFKTNYRYFSVRFKYTNDKLGLGKAGKYNTFSSHMLRKYHASNLIRKGSSGHSLTEKQVDALQGRAKVDTRKSYMFEDHESLREQYIECLDNITLYDDNSLVENSNKYKNIQKDLAERKQNLVNLEKEVKKLKEEKGDWEDEKVEMEEAIYYRVMNSFKNLPP